jgi:acyl-CoA reductase-like NAD-dependent aldehyde dehydrogenase
MRDLIETISPIDGRIVVTRSFADDATIDSTLAKAQTAQQDWQRVSIDERAAICSRFVDIMQEKQSSLSEQITLQMGRPLSQSPHEINGLAERARYMIDIAQTALDDQRLPEKEGFNRFIRRAPHGVVLTIAPWNYPYLTAINSIIPAIMAGNAVILKHSAQTPLCAEELATAFDEAGLPAGIFQVLHLAHPQTETLIKHSAIQFVVFTGSVKAGRHIQQAASDRFIGVALELGGKDPAYVRADADLNFAIDNLVDGVFYNSGQSCCGIERIYVAEKQFKDFVESFVEKSKQFRLGDPRDENTSLGPMVSTQAASFVRGQIDEAVGQGAKALLASNIFDANQAGTPYLAPQVLIDVDHRMRVMHEESFGPVVGVMPVKDDQEAIRLMNDSDFGLTASVWTQDESAAIDIGQQIETGTFFMNRCDYLDPALVWTGVKDSGRGYALSTLGYEQLTQAKSFHLRTRMEA